MIETEHTAYGLRLSCSFELAGLDPSTPTGKELPAMTLELCEPADIESAWSGSSGQPPWRGRLGDGLDLTIEQGELGEVLFLYGERARFLLDADKHRLGCAPGHAGLDWQRVLLSKVLPTISVLRGYEALHAAALQTPDGVVAIMAPSGAGKSTLALELMGRGWPLFADDALILESIDGKVIAHPGTPHMNVALDAPTAVNPDELGTTLAALAGERWFAAAVTAKQPASVRLLCMLERADGLELGSELLPSSPLQFAPYMLGLSTDAERERGRFWLYSDLMQSTPLIRITARSDQRPDELADVLQQVLNGRLTTARR